MITTRIGLVASTLLLIGLAFAAAVAAEPAPPLAPEVEAVLDKMEIAGKDLKTLHALFDYELNQPLYEDIQRRKGELTYEAPNHLRFEFLNKPQELFVFDGRILYNRKDATKQLMIWELRTPQEKPVESLELGRVPFPLPFGQKKADVLKHFTVTRDAKEEAADKDKRAVLVLVPRKETPLARDYTKILLWVDTKTNMPTRARLYDSSENITTVDFHDIQTNLNLKADLFDRPKVEGNWETVIHGKDK